MAPMPAPGATAAPPPRSREARPAAPARPRRPHASRPLGSAQAGPLRGCSTRRWMLLDRNGSALPMG